jgi:hypothetical protein
MKLLRCRGQGHGCMPESNSMLATTRALGSPEIEASRYAFKKR